MNQNPTHSLNDQQRVMLNLLADGTSVDLCARVMEIDVSSARTMCGDMMQTLNLHSETDLVRFAASSPLTG
jgi:DNA-binding CsgD family transcriptional regulator